MGQSNIDNMFQVIAPIADRTSSPARFGGDTVGFDDHLNQASTSVFDVARPPSRSDSTPSYSTSDNLWSASSYSSTSSSSIPRPADSGNSRKDREPTASSSSTSSVPAETKAAEKVASKTDHDDHEPENPKAGEDSELAGAAQVAGNSGLAKTDSSPTNSGEEHTNKTDNAAAELAAKQHAKRAAKAESKTAQQHSEGSASKKEADATVAGEETPIEATANESSEAESTETDATDAKPTAKATHENAEHVATAVKIVINAEEVAKEAAGPEATDAEPVAADKTATATPTNGNEKTSTAAKRGPTSEETPADALHATAESADSDAAPAPATSNATAVINGIAANVAADTTSKGEAVTDSPDPSGKSATGKTEPPANPLDRATRGTPELTRSNGSTKTDETTTRVDPARFVSRVAKAFQTANERGGTLQLRLSPPELGALRIQLTVKDGVLSASMETENAGARRVLLEHLPALRDRLAEQNISIEKFDVDVRQENTGAQANANGSNQNPYQPQPNQAQSRRASGVAQVTNETAQSESAPLAAKITSTKINLVV